MLSNFRKFMYGRYGVDNLTYFILIVYLVLRVVMLPLRFVPTAYRLIDVISYLGLALGIFRILSKNIAKRSEENRMYMNFYSEIKKRFYKLRGGMIERKDFHIYKCKSCGQKIRIPKGKGKIMVICPKCKNEFVKHS